jgi:hypothetical protein
VEERSKAAIEFERAVEDESLPLLTVHFDGYSIAFSKCPETSHIVGLFGDNHGAMKVSATDLDSAERSFQHAVEWFRQIRIGEGNPVPKLSEEQLRVRQDRIAIREYEANFRQRAYDANAYLEYRKLIKKNPDLVAGENNSTLFVWTHHGGPRTIGIASQLQPELQKFGIAVEGFLGILDGNVALIDSLCLQVITAISQGQNIKQQMPHAVANNQAIPDSLIDFLIFAIIEASIEESFIPPESFRFLSNLHLKISSGAIMRKRFGREKLESAAMLKVREPSATPGRMASLLDVDKATISRMTNNPDFEHILNLPSLHLSSSRKALPNAFEYLTKEQEEEWLLQAKSCAQQPIVPHVPPSPRRCP